MKIIIYLLTFSLLYTAHIAAVPIDSCKHSETHKVKYGKAKDGSIMHSGIWNDYIIFTVVNNAPNIGMQVIMLRDGKILDISKKFIKENDHFVNEYSWGKVISWDNKQIITHNKKIN